jgi:hypothetical protein
MERAAAAAVPHLPRKPCGGACAECIVLAGCSCAALAAAACDAAVHQFSLYECFLCADLRVLDSATWPVSHWSRCTPGGDSVVPAGSIISV